MKTKSNYLEKIPCHHPCVCWSQDADAIVTLQIKNKGLANRIAQKIFKKPEISYIHLEQFGSFVWTVIDGKRDIIAIGELVKVKFGNDAEPLYERLAQYIKTLEDNKFIIFN